MIQPNYTPPFIRPPYKAGGYREDYNTTPTGNITTATIWQADTNWVASQISAGTQVPTQTVTPDYNHPGQVQFTTSATNGQGLGMYKGNKTGGAALLGSLGASVGWDKIGIFKLGQTAASCVRFGFASDGQALTDQPSDWFGVEYNTANTGNSDTKFTWVTRASSGSPTYSTTNAINADTSYHRFRVRSVVAGTILFSVDDGVETAISTTITLLNMSPFWQFITRENVLKTITWDFNWLDVSPTR